MFVDTYKQVFVQSRDVEPGPARHEGGWQLIRTDDGQLLTVPALQQYAQRARAPDSTAVA